jgi:predicted dehydrogenase
MSQSKLRAGVIGVGVGRSHMRGYIAAEGSELVAICDVDPSRVDSVGAEYGVPAEGRYNDYKQMLTTANLDIVSVCLPNYIHKEVSEAAFAAGAHVVCEKPMATTVTEAQSMIESAERAGKQLVICYNYRYRADAQWIKKVIAAGHLGEINFVNATWRRETGIPGSGWFGRRALSGGGPLIDLGVHVLDLTLWFMGFPSIQTVSGATRSIFGPQGQKVWGIPRWVGLPSEPFDVEDGAVGFLRFGGGASAVIQATWGEHREPQADMIRIEIHGTKGAIHMTVPNYRHDDTLRMYMEIEGEPMTIIPGLRNRPTNGHELLIEDTVKALHAGTPVPVTGVEGLEAVRVLEAMYKSAESGHEVALEG